MLKKNINNEIHVGHWQTTAAKAAAAAAPTICWSMRFKNLLVFLIFRLESRHRFQLVMLHVRCHSTARVFDFIAFLG